MRAGAVSITVLTPSAWHSAWHSTDTYYYELTCVPCLQKIYAEVQTPIPQNVTLFGNKAFT